MIFLLLFVNDAKIQAIITIDPEANLEKVGFS